jgi:DNA-directed RNA polymerase specialized sigma24 family protein
MKKGFFVKNYSKKQIIIDPENFDPAVSYSTAKRVYWKNFRWSPLAQSIKEDLIQEAVTRMYELSGKVKENANGKYGIGYGFFWVAHNAMLSYLKTWKRQMRWRVFGDIEDEQMAARIYNSRKELIL